MLDFCREIPSKIPENPLVNHVIELLRHKRDLQGKIELMEEEGLVHRVDDLPKVKEPIPKGQLTVPNIPMTGRQTKEIMENRMTILLAHGGYTRKLNTTSFIFLHLDDVFVLILNKIYSRF